jgi:hypothetical protein
LGYLYLSQYLNQASPRYKPEVLLFQSTWSVICFMILYTLN